MKGRPKLRIISDREPNNCSNLYSVARRPPKLNIFTNISVRDICKIDLA